MKGGIAVCSRIDMAEGKSSSPRPPAFDLLFSRNVSHILEKIFLSLDYKTYKACHKVCTAWGMALASESFRRKAISVYAEKASLDRGLLMDMARLCRAMADGNIERIRKLIACGIVRKACVKKVKIKIGSGPSWGQVWGAPLHWAAKHGHADVVKALLEEGDNPNRRDIRGHTAMHMAILNGRIDIHSSEVVVRLLLEAGANPNEMCRPMTDRRYAVPALSLAAMEGHGDIARALLNAGADPNLTNGQGRTALFWANRHARIHSKKAGKHLVRILLEGGANP